MTFSLISDKIRKKDFRRDLIFLSVIYLLIFIIIFSITRGTYIYGSYVDWLTQHSVLPDYFRQKFYETGLLIPKFALDLGAGQNIFNLAYHGLLNPVILISYLLPDVSMATYVSVSSVIVVLLSITLMYVWLRRQPGLRFSVIAVATLIFACASPLTFHSHKQVMFMDYMPFLILAFMGVDKLYAKRKHGLLIINVCLMFLTSYFFAVSGIIILTIYGIYKHMSITPKWNLSLFFRDAFHYSLCIINGIMLACIILLPTFTAVINGRGEITKGQTSFAAMFVPNVPITELNYSSYGVGLTAVCIVALLAFVFIGRNKSRIFLTLSILAMSTFPICRYILNGTLYDRSKALIPFLPVIVLITAFFLEETIAKHFAIKRLLVTLPFIVVMCVLDIMLEKYTLWTGVAFFADLLSVLVTIYLTRKLNKPMILYCYIVILSIVTCIFANRYDTLESKDAMNTLYAKEKYQVVADSIALDSGIFRSNDFTLNKATTNILYSQNFRRTGVYASVSNQPYLNMAHNDIVFANPTINNIAIADSNDILFQTLMGVKYVLTDAAAPVGYSPIESRGNYCVYKNENVYPLGFATSNILSYESYKKLSPAEREAALLDNIIVENEMDHTTFSSPVKNSTVSIDPVRDFNFEKSTDGYYHAAIPEKRTVSIPLPEPLNRNIYVVECHIRERYNNNVVITVNGIKNSLSEFSATFPNENFNFKFVVSDSSEHNSLDFVFETGEYDISDFSVKTISYDKILSYRHHLTPMTDIHFDGNNVITGQINAQSSCYFTTTLPYDNGFKISVDGKDTSYVKTDNAFVGFKLNSGQHSIKIVYEPPFANIGMAVSMLGVLLLALILILQIKRKDNHYE